MDASMLGIVWSLGNGFAEDRLKECMLETSIVWRTTDGHWGLGRWGEVQQDTYAQKHSKSNDIEADLKTNKINSVVIISS